MLDGPNGDTGVKSRGQFAFSWFASRWGAPSCKVKEFLRINADLWGVEIKAEFSLLKTKQEPEPNQTKQRL